MFKVEELDVSKLVLVRRNRLGIPKVVDNPGITRSAQKRNFISASRQVPDLSVRRSPLGVISALSGLFLYAVYYDSAGNRIVRSP